MFIHKLSQTFGKGKTGTFLLNFYTSIIVYSPNMSLLIRFFSKICVLHHVLCTVNVQAISFFVHFIYVADRYCWCERFLLATVAEFCPHQRMLDIFVELLHLYS